MKHLIPFFLFVFLTSANSFAQSDINPVSDAIMQDVYEEIVTPYKYGLVMIHEDTSNMIDCPTVFRKDSMWYMTYLVYNGRGYETWLSKSEDLLTWEKLGKVLPFANEDRWDWNQAAGYMSLVDHTWGGSYELDTFDNKYWMSYFGSNTEGYEGGLLSIGMSFTDKDPTVPHAWHRLKQPVLKSTDDDAGSWENRKLFKSSIIRDTSKLTGSEFVMYYNACGDTSNPRKWIERIGMATSDDMVNWKRYENNPIINHHTGISGDAYIQKIDSLYVMFYFGAFWPEGRKDAFNRFACSYDLVHWTDWKGQDLVQCTEPYDEKYAHKPYVVKWNGVVYHFYCAVNELEQRGLAVATSKDLGESTLHYQPIKVKLKR